LLKLTPAANENVRQDGTSQSVTTTDYTTINETRTKDMNTYTATGFLEDADERIYEPFPITGYDPKMINAGLDTISRNDVIKILQTPVRIRTVNFSGSDGLGVTKDSWIVPFDSTNFQPSAGLGQKMWLSRLNAFQGFRATVVLEFKINVQRFCQGRLMAYYIPGQQSTNSFEAKSHRFDLTTKTQLPGVQINVNRDSTVKMRIPYVSPWPAYDLQFRLPNGQAGTMETAAGVMGTVYLGVYAPLQNTLDTFTVSVWQHFEDVELFNTAYAPQSGLNAQDQEAPKGTLSKTLNTVADAARVLTKIPSLSSIAGTTEWFTRASSRAASAFGFSAPFVESDPLRISGLQNPYTANSDGPRPEIKLGLSNSAKTEVLPGFAGNDLDEMNIEYLANRPAYIDRLTWSKADAVDASLFSYNLQPSTFSRNYTIQGGTVSTFVPIAYLARYFNLWRCDFVFTIKVVKTEFHMGRLELVFNPGIASAISTSAKTYMSRVILDLKESDTFVVKIPYTSLTPFMNSNEYYGVAQLNVNTPLSAPGTVTSSLDILVEVSAENVAFAQPVPVSFSPVNGDDTGFTPQSGLGDAEVAPREKILIMPGLKSSTRAIHDLRFTNPEACMSIKQLLSRFCIPQDDMTAFSTARTITFLPFTIGGYSQIGTTTVYQTGPFSGDLVSAFSSLFAIRRGSVRMFFNGKASDDSVVTMASIDSTAPLNSITSTATVSSAIFNRAPDDRNVSGAGLYVNVPQYSKTHSFGCQTVFGSGTRSIDSGEPTVTVSYSNATAIGAGFTWARMAGDDYQLGFFIGVPCMRPGVSFKDAI
jgi:hypothetical protein